MIICRTTTALKFGVRHGSDMARLIAQLHLAKPYSDRSRGPGKLPSRILVVRQAAVPRDSRALSIAPSEGRRAQQRLMSDNAVC